MAFVKLDCGILDSTLWVDRLAREIFITALLMAKPRAIEDPMPQIAVRTLDETGWVVPPGAYGFVEAAGIGIVTRAGLSDHEAGLEALERLCAPELDSRSRAFEGRRLARVEGGYVILNYDRYRQKDQTNAERQARYRERQKKDKSNAVTLRGNGVTPRDVTDADADAVKKEKVPASPSPKRNQANYLPDDFELTDARRQVAVKERVDPDRTFAAFCDYWRAASGARARKRDWDATWRNWCRRAGDDAKNRAQKGTSAVDRVRAATGRRL